METVSCCCLGAGYTASNISPAWNSQKHKILNRSYFTKQLWCNCFLAVAYTRRFWYFFIWEFFPQSWQYWLFCLTDIAWFPLSISLKFSYFPHEIYRVCVIRCIHVNLIWNLSIERWFGCVRWLTLENTHNSNSYWKNISGTHGLYYASLTINTYRASTYSVTWKWDTLNEIIIEAIRLVQGLF